MSQAIQMYRNGEDYLCLVEGHLDGKFEYQIIDRKGQRAYEIEKLFPAEMIVELFEDQCVIDMAEYYGGD